MVGEPYSWARAFADVAPGAIIALMVVAMMYLRRR